VKNVKYLKQNVVEIERGIVAHGCNCQGVMGSGVAAAVRSKWPYAYETYKGICEAYGKDDDLLGLVQFVTVQHERDDGVNKQAKIVVANMFTQQFYGNDGKVYADLKAIETALEQTVIMADVVKLPIYMPKVGCGLGGLNWKTDVQPIVERIAADYPDIEINICDL